MTITRRTALLASLGGAAVLTGCTSALPPAARGSRSAPPDTGSGSLAGPFVTTAPRNSGGAAALVHHAPVRAGVLSPSAAPPDPAQVRANELGVVPVMMYHRLTSAVGEFDITPAAFTAHLTRMFTAGYRPITVDDLARGQIDVPAGMTPVVLTFDDGSTNQFRLLPDGRLDPSCAAGVLSTVCARFADCHPRATFCINQNPFGAVTAAQQARTLQALLRFGFTLGNHTRSHADLGRLDDTQVQQEFVQLQQLVAAVAPKAQLTTMALPFGVAPRDAKLARSGRWNGTSYRFEATLLVGANPAPSPFARAFDPSNLPRIRVSSWRNGRVPFTANYWLDYLAAHPQQRYISAGNPAAITFPKSQRHLLAPGLAHRALAY